MNSIKDFFWNLHMEERGMALDLEQIINASTDEDALNIKRQVSMRRHIKLTELDRLVQKYLSLPSEVRNELKPTEEVLASWSKRKKVSSTPQTVCSTPKKVRSAPNRPLYYSLILTLLAGTNARLGVKELAERCYLTPGQVRNCLNKLKAEGKVTSYYSPNGNGRVKVWAARTEID